MRKIKFANDHFYHVYNRGVEKRDIFMDQNDYIRFIHNLYEFNDIKPALQFSRSNVGDRVSNIKRERERLVDIVCFCLMPNHFHLLLRQNRENGITRFLHKVGVGHTMVFNLKNERVGPLFQGAFKAAHVNDDVYLTHISRYIHLNPLEIKEPRFKEHGVKSWPAAEKFLNNYKWSSYPNFVGLNNFSSLLNGQEFIMRYFGKGAKEYKGFVRDWASKEIDIISESIFE